MTESEFDKFFKVADPFKVISMNDFINSKGKTAGLMVSCEINKHKYLFMIGKGKIEMKNKNWPLEDFAELHKWIRDIYPTL
jgi:hypothetical protein